MTNKIILRNDLVKKQVRVTEGNAGISRKLKVLDPGQAYKIENDPNATYREYIFITLPDEKPLRLVSSDDFAEFKEISIYEHGGVFDWRGIPRNPQQATAGGEMNTPAAPWWKAVLQRLSR